MSNQQVVKNSIEKELIPDIVEVTKGNIDQIKAAANYFLYQVQKCYESTIRSQGLIQKSSFSNGRQILYEYMKENTSFTQQITQLQHYFETQLDNFLGRKIYLAWVSQSTGTILYLDEKEIGQLYSKGRKFSYGGGSAAIKGSAVLSTVRAHHEGRLNLIEEIVSTQNSMPEELQKKLKESQNKRRYVYQNAILRYNQKGSGGRFWWRPSNQYRRQYTISFNGTGRIAEGYVGAVVNEDPNVEAYQQGDALETSLKFLYLNHIEIESIPGIEKGDVVMDSNKNIQFAVKTGDFKTAKFGPAYILATEIQRGEFLSASDIQNNLSELVKTEDVALSILENIYTDLQKQLMAQAEKITKS